MEFLTSIKKKAIKAKKSLFENTHKENAYKEDGQIEKMALFMQ